jgi:hypothetical protein
VSVADDEPDVDAPDSAEIDAATGRSGRPFRMLILVIGLVLVLFTLGRVLLLGP